MNTLYQKRSVDDPVFAAWHAQHVRFNTEAAQRGEKGRACTVPAVTLQNLQEWEPLLQSLTGAAAEGATRLHAALAGHLTGADVQLPSREYVDWLANVIFQTVPDNSPVRNVLFHMAWHVTELLLGRVPS